jgi:hypothetical protein
MADVHQATGQPEPERSAIWDDAKGTARAKLNEQKDAAAAGIGDMAETLRDAARQRDGDDDAVARITASAAAGLDRFSGALRSKDVSAMLRDIEGFSRRQPVAFFGLALAAGFLAVRFAKASDR